MKKLIASNGKSGNVPVTRSRQLTVSIGHMETFRNWIPVNLTDSGTGGTQLIPDKCS